MTLYEHKHLHILDKKKPKKKTEVLVKPSEEAIHRSIADYLDTVVKRPSRWHTVEVSNQQAGKAGMFKQMALKRRGVRTSWPDICIYWEQCQTVGEGVTEFGSPYKITKHSGMFKIIFLEVKIPGDKANDKQAALHQELREDGHHVFVVHSIEETQAALKEVGMI